jgi:uncharacterized membrane protein
MARSSSSSSEIGDLKWPLAIGLFFIVIWLVNRFLETASEKFAIPVKFIFIGGIDFIVVCFVAALAYRGHRAERSRLRLFFLADHIIQQHLPTLISRRGQLVSFDPYGGTDLDR